MGQPVGRGSAGCGAGKWRIVAGGDAVFPHAGRLGRAAVAAATVGLLETQGHAVHRAEHGLAALSELAAASYDVVLIDLDLPGVDGFTLARTIRTQEAKDARRHLRLIGISARSRGDEEALCRSAGMDAFVRKPVTGEMLAGVLVEQE